MKCYNVSRVSFAEDLKDKFAASLDFIQLIFTSTIYFAVLNFITLAQSSKLTLQGQSQTASGHS